jgi:hypothetical protein
VQAKKKEKPTAWSSTFHFARALINKKACTPLDWVARLTYNFGNNYGSFHYILDYLALRKCTQSTFLAKYCKLVRITKPPKICTLFSPIVFTKIL